jgi:hypothetical protein
MIRGAALLLVVVLASFPLAVLPAAPVTWFAVAAVVVGGVGAAALSVPLVTAAGSLALIAWALALAIVRPEVDPVAALAFGATLVVLLPLVHLGARVRGAAVAPAVIAAQLRQALRVAVLGVVVGLVLAGLAAVVAPALGATSLPLVIVAAALGALLAIAGAIALVSAR